MAAESFIQENLVTNPKLLVTSPEVLDTGNLAIGSVLGKKTLGAVPTTGTADGGNTGDGTVTAVVGKKNTKIGVYKIINIEAVANGGIFQVLDPNGKLVEEITIPAGAGASVNFSSDELAGTITDGAADFALGDFFTVTTIAGDNKLILSASAAVDGSNKIYGILSEAADASAADVNIIAYLAGGFNEDTLVFGVGHTKASLKAEARELGIYFDAAQSQ